ncbi:hypothetical protein [Rahnella victoriana]|uniref:Morphogenetic protein n=1 Tax=Rahnella victoriana TaxID=1510570 RepID=A0ABS0DQJ7_9GAMM|nr:hypothetical protein [Rahnella victoriana]MBF7956165.1 hypothetical protein [Rahnella victoriana]
MKERPILFNAEMVKAILSGRKTQTRRIIKLDHERGFQNPVVRGRAGEVSSVEFGLSHMLCPLGQPGDQLWVREAIFPAPLEMQSAPPHETLWNIAYRDGQQLVKLAPAAYNPTLYNYERWTPSIHMPRWASRINLLITGVRVERLDDISQHDARCEGIVDHHNVGQEKYLFSRLWRDIYGEESWATNPWIWVIEFERVAPAGNQP